MEVSENYRAPVVDCLRCKHVSRRLEEDLSVQKQTHVHWSARRRCFNLQIQRPERRVYSDEVRPCCSQSQLVDDFESRPHKTETFLVERDEGSQVWREQKCPKHHQDSLVESCQDVAKVEGREGEEEDEEGPKKLMENEWMNGRHTLPGSGVTRKVVFLAQCTNAERDPGTALGMKQEWDCSQVQDECEEGDVMDWLEDDEMMMRY